METSAHSPKQTTELKLSAGKCLSILHSMRETDIVAV